LINNPIHAAAEVMDKKPSQNSLFKADTGIKPVAESESWDGFIASFKVVL
jgi:hypothetical protein